MDLEGLGSHDPLELDLACSRRLLGEKVMALGTFFRKLWKFLRWEKCNTLIPTYLLPDY